MTRNYPNLPKVKFRSIMDGVLGFKIFHVCFSTCHIDVQLLTDLINKIESHHPLLGYKPLLSTPTFLCRPHSTIYSEQHIKLYTFTRVSPLAQWTNRRQRLPRFAAVHTLINHK